MYISMVVIANNTVSYTLDVLTRKRSGSVIGWVLSNAMMVTILQDVNGLNP